MSGKREDRFKGIEQNESGEFEYTGEYCRMKDDAGDGKVRGRIIALLVILTAAVIASGLSEAEPATHAFYVILPYVGEVTSLFILSWGTVAVLSGGSRVRATVIERNRGRIIGGASMLSIFAIAGLIMTLVYLLINGMGENAMQTALYSAAKAATAVIAFGFRKFYSMINWEISG